MPIPTSPMREIPVSELRPGLTVWTQELVHGKERWVPDVYLADYLLGDYSPREFILGHRLQFITDSGHKVVWRNCGHVMVSIGRVNKR
jgi:hypothetical protein